MRAGEIHTFSPSQINSYKERAKYAYKQGLSHYKHWEYKKAINDYTNALEYTQVVFRHDKKSKNNNGAWVLHYNRGLCYQKIKQYQKAVNDYQKARSINPKSAKPILAIGKLFNQLKNNKVACKYFNLACDLGYCLKNEMKFCSKQ